MPSHVRIVVRTRPTDFAADAFRIVSNNTISIARAADAEAKVEHHTSLRPLASGTEDAAKETLNYNVDSVLNNVSQEVVYDSTASELVESALQGFNCTLLCYGQCGSGKTYTLFGADTFPTRGCIPRAIEELFNLIKVSTKREFSVSLTFVEVYGEQVFDLLAGKSAAATAGGGKRGIASSPTTSGDRSNAKNKLNVTIDGSGAVVLRGVKQRQCSNGEEALSAVFEGMQKRMSCANQLNPQSSRSHAVLTFYIVSKSLVDSDAMTHHSRCNFVDLAGSERPSSPQDEAARREMQMINRSLIMLEQVVLAMSGSRPRHVPYRQSKLTMLLKDSIGGTSKTTLIANIWPEQRHMEATLATLNFAKRLVRVESHPSVHALMDPQAQIKMLQKQVASLKAELRMQDQMAGREAVATAPLDRDEIQAAQDRVMPFVDGTVPRVNVTCVRDMHACFSVFKQLLDERVAQIRDLEQQLTITPRPGSSSSGRGLPRHRGSSKQHSVLETKEQMGYANTTADKNTGIGMGTTEKPSPGLRDMFQLQQQARGTNASKSASHTTLSTGASVKGGSEEYASTPDKVTTVTTSRPIPPAPPKLGPGEVSVKTLPSFDSFNTRNPENSAINTVPCTAKPDSKSTASDLKPIGRQGGVVRDRRAAFEAYKRTAVGASQMKSIKDTQDLLMEKNEIVVHLQRRVEELKAQADSCKWNDQEKITPGGELTATRCFSIELPGSPPGVSETSSIVNDATTAIIDAASPFSADVLPKIPPTDTKALLRHTSSALTRATVEHGAVVKQLNRLREAFLNNFQYWYQMYMQSSLLQPRDEKTLNGTAVHLEQPFTAKDRISSPNEARRVRIQHVEGDPHYMDFGEQYETAKMRRRVQEDPESATFYAAQKLASRFSSR